MCLTYDSLLQTLQVLFSLLMALMQESVGNSHRINSQLSAFLNCLSLIVQKTRPEDINDKQIVVCS